MLERAVPSKCEPGVRRDFATRALCPRTQEEKAQREELEELAPARFPGCLSHRVVERPAAPNDDRAREAREHGGNSCSRRQKNGHEHRVSVISSIPLPGRESSLL